MRCGEPCGKAQIKMESSCATTDFCYVPCVSSRRKKLAVCGVEQSHGTLRHYGLESIPVIESYRTGMPVSTPAYKPFAPVREAFPRPFELEPVDANP